MEEQEYRAAYKAVSQRPCLFEKAVLGQHCNCRFARRFCLADREGVACQSEQGHEDCRTLLETLREKARFALQMTQVFGPLPHSREIRVQVGGLRGLRAVLGRVTSEGPGEDVSRVEDVAGLTEAALSRFGAFDRWPFEQIVQHIVRFEGRSKRSGKRSH